jgi:hypothetical protein
VNKRISNSELAQLAKEQGIPFANLKAFALVEGSGSGFNADDSLKIQFEPHHFKLDKIENGVGNQKEEYAAFNEAKAINLEAAQKATSWGMFQIMGFNYALAGYKSVAAMVAEFQLSEYYQVKAAIKFMKSTPGLFKAVCSGNWKVAAELYNGKAYWRLQYDKKLAAAHETAKKIKV